MAKRNITVSDCGPSVAGIVVIVVVVFISFFLSFAESHIRISTTTMSMSSYATGSIPSIIVGGGRIGSMLANELGTDGDYHVRNRGDEIITNESPSFGPIYVCTRNDDMTDVVKSIPSERRSDLCFVQNGMLGDFLVTSGLSSSPVATKTDDKYDNNDDEDDDKAITQVLLYLAVPKVGAKPVDGITELNPEGLTCATGKWARELQGRLAKGGLSCLLKSGSDYAIAALEKHVFICTTNVVGQLDGRDWTVGYVYSSRCDMERRSLMTELIRVGASKVGIDDDSMDIPKSLERLEAYGRSVPDFPTAMKEFPWRNGWFYDVTTNAIASGRSDPLPLHTAALQKLGVI